jgi:hypothetical protein
MNMQTTFITISLVLGLGAASASAQSRFEELANLPFRENRPTEETANTLRDELLGLDNGQPFPSLGKLNKPRQESDGSTVLHLAPKPPTGKEGNWLATVPGRGYFAILRLYAPTEPAIQMTWKPGDIQKVK